VRVVPLLDADRACGGKAAALGALLRASLPVPPGWVMTGLRPGAEHDPALLAVVTVALERLGGGAVAVRSSAPDEDGPATSWAGVLETVLGVCGPEAVTDAVLACVASTTAPPAQAYRRRLGRPTTAVAPVLVQSLVAADCSGVLFTRHPVTGADEVLIEAAFGLGPSVVTGAVVPDRVTVRSRTVEVEVGEKATRLDAVDGRLVRTDVPPRDRGRPCLTDDQVRRLAGLGAAAVDLLGGPQDLEWALAGDDLWLLQSRPVTGAAGTGGPRADPLGGAVPAGDAPAAAGPGPLARGVPASPGVATGTVRVLDDPGGRLEPGDVLVCTATSPAWTRLLSVAGAVVTETGTLLSHAAIVAREFGIPAVVSVRSATTLLVDGSTVTVDGWQGTVTDASPGPGGDQP
jgi:pyruvate,water dikinase